MWKSFIINTDNGVFYDKSFIVDVTTEGQTISFYRANAHWQNGIAEKKIRNNQEHVRKMILFAKSKWPKAVNTHLWPYALHHAVNIANIFPKEIKDMSRLEKNQPHFNSPTTEDVSYIWVPCPRFRHTSPDREFHFETEFTLSHRPLPRNFPATRSFYTPRAQFEYCTHQTTIPFDPRQLFWIGGRSYDLHLVDCGGFYRISTTTLYCGLQNEVYPPA